MKRIIVFLAVTLIISGAVFAEESVLIDFNDLLDDYQGEHQATLVDFSSVAGTRFTEDEKAAMNTSLYVPNWDIELSSSSRNVTNDRLSYVRAVTVNENANQFAGEQVMGVRVHYPEGSFNSYAWVKPPFAIPAYATSPVIEDAPRGDQFTGFGVVKNVGVIKSIKVNVYGMNYPMGMSVVLVDEQEQTQQIPLGYLDFDGWRELTWNNPNYISEVRNRELSSVPLYPRSAPSVTLDSLQFYRDAMQEGGDFISYVKDVTVVYDQAIIQDVDTDLNHEEVWGILSQREEERRNAELNRLGNLQVLRYLEEQKMHQEPEDADTAQ
ncbi:MAG: flagellar filament outer layer protein FlaA [Spirochaetaceae bacterium]|nr:flagellar filament outer layer protein FlaA [Spirochaetaceae bacterium]MDT8297063.1 flagellar filament outer layer protein FlaA [Spirochaetaceae bacterium]